MRAKDLGRDPDDAQLYAVKQPKVSEPVEGVHSLKSELEILLNLQKGTSPPSHLLPRAIGWDLNGIVSWVAMPYIHGCKLSDLEDELKKRNVANPVSFAFHAFVQLLKTFEFVHPANAVTGKWGIAHDDLVPWNIVLDVGGTPPKEFPNVIVVDYGNARHAEAGYEKDLKGEDNLIFFQM